MGARGNHTVDTSKQLAALRELMKKENVDVWVVPSEDQHYSEYLAHCDERRAFISGFNGSAGCAVITLDKAYLFTDGRYFLQAEKQLDSNWTLMKQGLPDVPTWQDFLHKTLDGSLKIGIDATIITEEDAAGLRKNLAPKKSELVPSKKNLVDIVWGSERPARPQNPVFHLDEKYSGQSFKEKVKKVREEIAKEKGKAFVVTMLDEVAWLFNLRGSDIDYNPVFFAYAVVTPDEVVLFINEKQLDDAARDYLGQDVKIRGYDELYDYLKELPKSLSLTGDKDGEKILVTSRTSLAITETITPPSSPESTTFHKVVRSPVGDLKAIKNAVEIEGFRQCHIRDGAALARYFAWLEEALNEGKEVSEYAGAEVLEKYRSELDLFRGLSFTTISSTGPNGAIIHYSPDPQDCAIIKKDQVYLCDSGAQFSDGTTDVTRTWHFGTPRPEEVRAFTRVLQGHIAIDTAVFPNGTTGYLIDSWARRSLWQDGLDYRHGTGHGVGHFLNVHEGPQGIGVRIAYNNTALKAGMTVSNEPGYYEDGQYGIRIENIVIVKEVKLPNNFGDKGYLGFEHVTMCPIQTKLIDASLLTEPEKKWVNDYHQEVWQKVSPLLQNDKRALEWLKRETTPI
ncbi:aminopeptidase P [Coprinopsis cinerea okayama7|uniref:Probable Xaa-Pro aminopeptidase P n=1 Tax=Coprinopsis cinerea (strain Okayama-7 / 130 / ATCC MYA-4618 / FGSC 9003) TaxID=240176 RepID=AMPP1_COPC7|nr:aminopeptidase P [Coprinopsis cinerea okayama7\|eukprot:XP_001838946.1 aminopeptidase P [Coprinopsis cinerea okayama7\